MKKIKRANDELERPVIYVEDCEKFEYEIQPDMPAENRRNRVYISNNRLPKKEDFDIIQQVENYRKDSGK